MAPLLVSFVVLFSELGAVLAECSPLRAPDFQDHRPLRVPLNCVRYAERALRVAAFRA
jgi:hypothetical protein